MKPEEKRDYDREYRNRPDVRARSRARREANRETNREYMNAFNAKPEQRAKKSVYDKAYRQVPENNKRLNDYQKRPDVIVRKNEGRVSGNGRTQRDEYRLQWLYAISSSDRQALIDKQLGRCAICAEELIAGKHTHTDHCHRTGKVRGMLCATCNVGLGHFKDDPARLRAAAHYLEAHSSEAGRADGTTGLQELANALR